MSYLSNKSGGGGGGGTPSAPLNGIQYNNGGAFGADALATRDAVTKVSQIFRPFSYASGYTFDIDTVPAAIVPSNEPFIDGESLTFYEYGTSAITFTGTGLDDLSNSGSNFYGTYPTTYTVTVASSGTPDTFDWTDGTNSGTGVSMATSSIPLSNGVEISFGSEEFHTPGDSWSWTYSTNSVGTATLIHQEVGSPLIFQFYSSVTGTPDIANYVVGATSGATVDVAQYFSNSTFTASESVFSVSTDYVVSPMATITSVPGADNYIIAGASGFDQYSILANEDDGKYGGIISSTSTPIVSNAQAGFITNDNILGLGVDGSGILFDNTDNSDYGFTGIFNQNGISGGIRLNQEGIMTTLDMSKTGFGLTLNDGSHTTALAMDFQNISLRATHPSNGNQTGIVIDSNFEVVELGDIGNGAKITVDNETDGTISLNTSNSPSSPSIQLSESTGKIRFNQAYTFPISSGATGQVLALDASNNLEWTTISSSGSPITIGTSGNTLYSSGLSGTGQGGGSGNNIILGVNAGSGATNANSSNFFGYQAGQSATNANSSNFLGVSAGAGATNAAYSNFLGSGAGNSATNASNSNFFGPSAGSGATNASYSNFSGWYAGQNATNASNSNFFGYRAGNSATEADYSIFIGTEAGYQATNANRSIFIGQYAGYGDTVDNSSSSGLASIVIGTGSNTGGYSDSIALGSGVVNTATNQFMIGKFTNLSVEGKINDIRWGGILTSAGMHNNALAQGNASAQQVRSGTYTPTLTNVTNITTSTAYKFQWMRVGNVVTVSGRVNIQNTATGASELGISLPIASDIGATTDCVGSAPGSTSGILDDVGWVIGDATNNRASMQSTAVGTGAHDHWVSFTYEVK